MSMSGRVCSAFEGGVFALGPLLGWKRSLDCGTDKGREHVNFL